MSVGERARGEVLAGPERRKELGAWYTPDHLVDLVVEGVIDAAWVARHDRPIRVLDPACGDGRFLRAARRRIEALGGGFHGVGVDLDPDAIAAFVADDTSTAVCDDALSRDWADERFDVVIGNPPFRSQLAASTARGRASAHGGGPYADTAVEFLALGVRLAEQRAGRVAMILPQSLLSSRDAGPVREEVDRRSRMFWSWTSDDRHFDAQVRVCALGFERRGADDAPLVSAPGATWAAVVNASRGIPDTPVGATDGRLGDRALLNANFRDEYYGLVPAVGAGGDGPPLITSGLIDPGRCHWRTRPVRFNKRTFERPRVDLDALDARMRSWADRRLVPKVLVANQTSVIEAVADPDGAWLPGVPVVAVYPATAHSLSELPLAGERAPASVWDIAAVLTSPYATAWAWGRQGGTGLSATTIRLSPTLLAELPWPAGPLDAAVEALRRGDVSGCGLAVDAAYDSVDDRRFEWWRTRVDAIARRSSPHR